MSHISQTTRKKGSCRRAGITLLETVIAMGIVAVVGTITVIAVLKIREAGRDVSCQFNLGQIVKGLMAYTLDNKTYFPYGFYWEYSHPTTWQALPGDNRAITWVEQVNKYIGPDSRLISPLFRCPEAQEQVQRHPNSYVMNMIVAISPIYELLVGQPPYAQTKPSRLSLMRKEGTALIWDTAIKPGWENMTSGYLVGADIDGQRFWEGALAPQWRYFSPHDPYGQFPGGYGNNSPIRLNVASNIYRNIDPPANAIWPYQGNLRFRHNAGQTGCNVGFSDGSVRQLTAVIGSNNTVTSHNAIRRYFMTEWPPGVPPNPSFPY